MSSKIWRTKASQSVVSTSSTNKKAPLGVSVVSASSQRRKAMGNFSQPGKQSAVNSCRGALSCGGRPVNLTAPRGEGCPRVKGCSRGDGGACRCLMESRP
ncbi:hypothetical protein CDAR_417041 [Caerostris darwini]|uniref:Uncharacterized protein n=1 Tax=Caerostris darwini TaxID=1538125 RepID=A0AAV4X650_9ARAC|nr:hypothetical protein CDAR_417041 [Caerostris darwini]